MVFRYTGSEPVITIAAALGVSRAAGYRVLARNASGPQNAYGSNTGSGLLTASLVLIAPQLKFMLDYCEPNERIAGCPL